MSTAFAFDSIFLEHDTGLGHPECKERVQNVMAHLQQESWFSTLKQLQIEAATREWVHTIHKSNYVDRAKKACLEGQGFLDVADVSISRSSYDAAMMAVGGTLALCDSVISGKSTNGFGLLRPPGHHAENDLAMGFCLFNNIAIAAKYLQQQHGLDKILILDWDVHHGNGTQHSFEADPSVLFISTHQFPYYPGTGASHETGTGRGQGYTLNCPMQIGSNDNDYRAVWEQKILSRINSFQPEFILISAGFDAHSSDPLAQINLSTEFFGWMTNQIIECADTHANGRIVSLLEGGYNLDYLPLCVDTHLKHLMRN